MKKITALVLALVLVFALCACGGSKGAAGTWEIQSVKYEGETITVDDNPQIKGMMVIVLNDDGGGTITLGGDTHRLTWDDSNITVDGDPAPYSVSDNVLTIWGGDFEYRLVRK